MRIKLSSVVSKQFVLRLISLGVFFNGLIILLDALTSHVTIGRRNIITHDFRITLPIVIGMTLVYLATLLNRRKHAAWLMAIFVYAFTFGVSLTVLVDPLLDGTEFSIAAFARRVILPLVVLLGLAWYRDEFSVKSDIRNFRFSARIILAMLLIAFCYGVIGFQLLDKRDFHEEISLIQSAHYTVDQFGLTTSHVIAPYTERGRVFLNSLSLVSLVSIFYALASLFQPIKAKLTNQEPNREYLKRLMNDNPDSSEDFFKLWPHDKSYIFNKNQTAGLAFHVDHGVALCKGDPSGKRAGFGASLRVFDDLCRTNDWLPALIHTQPKYSELYRDHGFTLQKIGEEAIVNLDHFSSSVANSKYFRQINNRFSKQGFTVELLSPPHNSAVIARLKELSNDWLELPGRSERGFMMGYFSEEYMQQCMVLVMRDAASTIQAFLNQIPSFGPKEASYDLLRYGSQAPGNSNDYLLMNFIGLLKESAFERLNLGLCPLAGMEEHTGDKAIIDAAMRFVYSNGDKLYSFSGLHKFKQKYEPKWEDRLIAYKGGLRGFTRTVNALNRTMSKSAKNTH